LEKQLLIFIFSLSERSNMRKRIMKRAFVAVVLFYLSRELKSWAKN